MEVEQFTFVGVHSRQDIVTFGQMYDNLGSQAKMMGSALTEGMVIAKMTEIGKEAGTQRGREVLRITDATVKETLRASMERGARDLEEAGMSHLGHVMKVAQKKVVYTTRRPPNSETGGTKTREGIGHLTETGTGEPKQTLIPNGWIHWSQRTRSRGIQKMT